jgi:dTDP-4-dehydrorhamnose reductase
MLQYLIIGCNGLIGRKLSSLCEKKGVSWIGTFNKRNEPEGFCLDITSETDVREFILERKPRYIVHCANLSGGANFCEKNRPKAEKFHLHATQFIGRAAKEIDATLVFYSSDYVFDGKKNSPYCENDEPNPLNYYGKIKVEAENWLKESLEKYVILRTTNVYGWDPKTVTPNFLMGLYRKTQEITECAVPSYLWGNPTYAGDLAEIAVTLCEKEIHGLFHTVGDENINRYEWAKRILSKFNLTGELLVEQKEMQKRIEAPRPSALILDNSLLKKVLKFNFKSIDEGLQICFAESIPAS